MGNFKSNQRKLKQEDKNDNFKDVWDGSEIHILIYLHSLPFQPERGIMYDITQKKRRTYHESDS